LQTNGNPLPNVVNDHTGPIMYVPSRAASALIISLCSLRDEKPRARATWKRKLTFEVRHGEAKAVYPGGGAVGGGSPPPGHYRRRHRDIVQALRKHKNNFVSKRERKLEKKIHKFKQSACAVIMTMFLMHTMH
jgi:hypothetical protein